MVLGSITVEVLLLNKSRIDDHVVLFLLHLNTELAHKPVFCANTSVVMIPSHGAVQLIDAPVGIIKTGHQPYVTIENN